MTHLIEECNATWSAAWEFGGAVCRDEAVVPHTGGRCLALRLDMARKPHSAGIKLYVLADNAGAYAFAVYRFTRRRGKVHCSGSCAGKYDAKRSCAYGRGLSLRPRSFVRSTSSEVMGLLRNSRHNADCFSRSQSVISEMQALQGRRPLPRRATWDGQLWSTRTKNLLCTRTQRWDTKPHAWFRSLPIFGMGRTCQKTGEGTLSLRLWCVTESSPVP